MKTHEKIPRATSRVNRKMLLNLGRVTRDEDPIYMMMSSFNKQDGRPLPFFSNKYDANPFSVRVFRCIQRWILIFQLDAQLINRIRDP